MKTITFLCFLSFTLLIDCCTIEELISNRDRNEVIFTGRILSFHRWSSNNPFSAFIWVSKILFGEQKLLKYYQTNRIHSPLYLIIDDLWPCQDRTLLKYYDVKIFAVQIKHSRFYSNLPPLPISLTNMKLIDGLIPKGTSELESNSSNYSIRQSSSKFEFHRKCIYGRAECLFGATCTEENLCQCIFNCNETSNGIDQNDSDRLIDVDHCQVNQAQCEAYYYPASTHEENSACSSLQCSHGSKCSTDENGSSRCYCPDDCHEYAHEISAEGRICASDNHTYENICEMHKIDCQYQQNLSVVHLGECGCKDSTCSSTMNDCQSFHSCSPDSRPVCASNFQDYPNKCEMHKYACHYKIRLSKLHDGPCTFHEEHRRAEVCKALICLNRKTCMIEDGIGVCRCLFNCTSDQNSICASNGLIYQNLCELERASCQQENDLFPVDSTYCQPTCDPSKCPYGHCQLGPNGQTTCQCISCPSVNSDAQTVCGNDGITYQSPCHLEYDACFKNVDIHVRHVGACNNCHNVTCPFHGQCQSLQGNYSCVCPKKSSCSTSIQTDDSYTICGSNQQLFSNQCEMNVKSCELQTYLYAIAPEHCRDNSEKSEYSHDCAYDEPLPDFDSNRTVECDALGRCPINSYCNAPTNRCCTKVITAILPYRRCLNNEQCGRNMICLDGLCECEKQNFVPARHKRECIAAPHLAVGISCLDSPYGCCLDNVTISPGPDRQGCPEYCNCHPIGSLQSLCDPLTGSCYCRPAVGGSSCSHCENEYWGFSRILTHNNTGCTPCGCHPYGSLRKDCLQDTGECSCQPYATGRQCDRCINSSLILTERGCVSLQKGRRRQRTCRDMVCLFEGICQVINGQPRCTCHHVSCTADEQRLMSICASDGRTYKSKCSVKRQQCLKQYEIGLIYPGVCTPSDSVSRENSQYDDEFPPIEEEAIYDISAPMVPVDSKRCRTNEDCGENMVCLSEFCECAKQKYKRIPGPRCIAPHSMSLVSNHSVNPVRRTTVGACIRRTPCENHATCVDRPDGNYKCLCAFGWQGRHCNEKFQVSIPHFNRQSYFELKVAVSNRNSENHLLRLDLVFASENPNGLLLYTDDKFTEFYLIISIRNQIVDITVRLEHFVSTIQLSEIIELNTYARLQVHLLNNEIRTRLNDGNISSKSIAFGNSFKNTLYLGGLPESLHSLYQRFHLNNGFHGCIHELFINDRRVTFNSSEHHTILSAQNIGECYANPCRSTTISCRDGTRCIPIRNNDTDNYRCVCDDYLSSLSNNGLTKFQSDCSLSLIDRCSSKPCQINEQCINEYPNSFSCICLNCSSALNFIAGFHSSSYIKRPPFDTDEKSSRFSVEVWFLSELPSGLIVYSEHVNPKRGHFSISVQRRLVVFHWMLGGKMISLSSRYPIELNRWHQCSIEIYGQKLSLVVDDEAPVVTYELFSNNFLWPRSSTFLGHLPIQYRSLDALTSPIILDGFRGAIQKIFINGQSLIDVRQDALEMFNITDYSGYPCHPNPCSSNEICFHKDLNYFSCQNENSPIEKFYSSIALDGRTSLMYRYQPSSLNRNYFRIHFRTKDSHGLVFYFGENKDLFSEFLSLTIVNGFLKFSSRTDRNQSSVSLTSKIRVDDGRWHRAELERLGQQITMKLDGFRPRSIFSSTKQSEIKASANLIYIAGFQELCGHDEQHCQMFRGCLKNILLDKTHLDLLHDEINRNSSINICNEHSAG